MRRNRPPTLVSMWMLDVFCCALGCVTLLWLLKTREAGQIADDADQAAALLSETRGKLDESEQRSALRLANADRLATELDALYRHLALVEQERDEHATNLALARTERDETANCQFAATPNEVTPSESATAIDGMSAIEKFSHFMRFLAPPAPSTTGPGTAAA